MGLMSKGLVTIATESQGGKGCSQQMLQFAGIIGLMPHPAWLDQLIPSGHTDRLHSSSHWWCSMDDNHHPILEHN